MRTLAAVAIALVAVVALAGGKRRAPVPDAGTADPCAIDAKHPAFKFDGGTRLCVVVGNNPLTVACRDSRVDGGVCRVFRSNFPRTDSESALDGPGPSIIDDHAGDFGPYESPYVQPAGNSFDQPDVYKGP